MWSEILRCSGVAEIPKHQIETSPSRCTPRVASTTYRAFSLEIAETAASPYSLAWCCPAQWLEWIEIVDLPKHGEPDLTKMLLVVPFSSISSTSSKCLQLSELAGSQSHCIYTRRVTDQLEKLVWCNSSVRRFVRCIWVWLHHITSFFRGSEFSWIQSQTVYLEVAESKARMMPEQMANPASNAKMTLAESAVQSPDQSRFIRCLCEHSSLAVAALPNILLICLKHQKTLNKQVHDGLVHGEFDRFQFVHVCPSSRMCQYGTSACKFYHTPSWILGMRGSICGSVRCRFFWLLLRLLLSGKPTNTLKPSNHAC